MKCYMLLDLVVPTFNCKGSSITIAVTILQHVYSFIDENGNRYSALTTLRINGADVLAINSSKVNT